MQFSLQALPFSRHAQNDWLFGQLSPAADALKGLPQLATACGARKRLDSPLRANGSTAQRPAQCQPVLASTAQARVRILRNSAQGGRLLISGRMADVCAALDRLAVNEFASH